MGLIPGGGAKIPLKPHSVAGPPQNISDLSDMSCIRRQREFYSLFHFYPVQKIYSCMPNLVCVFFLHFHHENCPTAIKCLKETIKRKYLEENVRVH